MNDLGELHCCLGMNLREIDIPVPSPLAKGGTWKSSSRV